MLVSFPKLSSGRSLAKTVRLQTFLILEQFHQINIFSLNLHVALINQKYLLITSKVDVQSLLRSLSTRWNAYQPRTLSLRLFKFIFPQPHWFTPLQSPSIEWYEKRSIGFDRFACLLYVSSRKIFTFCNVLRETTQKPNKLLRVHNTGWKSPLSTLWSLHSCRLSGFNSLDTFDTTSEDLKTEVSLWKRIKSLPFTLHWRNIGKQHSSAILDSYLEKSREGKSRDYSEVIVFKKFSLSLNYFLSTREQKAYVFRPKKMPFCTPVFRRLKTPYPFSDLRLIAYCLKCLCKQETLSQCRLVIKSTTSCNK